MATPCLVIRRTRDGAEMERHAYDGDLDDRAVVKAIQQLSRGMGPRFYVDDGEVVAERRRLESETTADRDSKAIAKVNRGEFLK